MSRARDRAINERIEEWSAAEVAELIDIRALDGWPLQPRGRLGWRDVCSEVMIIRLAARPADLGPWTGGVTGT